MDNKPKYQILKEKIIDYIQVNELKYNDPINSEMELMEMFDVSRHTVRRAIADLVNDGWLYKQQGKGTFVDNPEGEKAGVGKSVAVITTYMNDYIFPEIISGIEHRLSEHGYTVLIGNTNNKIDKERQILSNMLGHNLAGLIVEPTKSVFPNHNKDIYDEFISKGIPVLFIHATYQNVKASYIVEDDVRAGYMATKYLIDKGHKDICGLFKEDDMQGHGRYEGYLKAIRESELSIRDGQVTWFTTETRTQVLDSFKEKSKEELLDLGSAYVVYNDQVANRFVKRMLEKGVSIPDDLSVISFDNASIARNGKVHLTTIAHPKKGVGELAADGLIQLLNKEVTVIEKVFEPELIVRDSVKDLT